MPTVLVSDIQERVRTLCDLPAYTTTTPITSAMILDYVTVSANLLGALVKEASSEMYFVSSSTLTTTAGVAFVSVPSGFADLLRLSWQKSSSQDIPLDVADVDAFDAYPQAWGNRVPQYRLIGQTIQFYPTPDAAYTLNCYYSTGLRPTSASDSLVLRDGWDLWIGLQAAVFVRMRQQKEASDITAMLGKVESDLKRQLHRDRFGPRQVRDLRGYAGRMLPRHGRWY